MAQHERTLLGVARRSSLCDDDAQDAYQRALEIFVRRAATVDPKTEVAWLKVVVRHEAMAIRRSRLDSVNNEELDLDEFPRDESQSIEDQIASSERVRRSAEALRSLKHDEAMALLLKAHGFSYDEIGQRRGWSYTKVNRAITEGRRRFLAVYEEIESGEECERFSEIVDALGTGRATVAQLLRIRPHLRHCTACRASVRELHLSRLRNALLLWPFPAVHPSLEPHPSLAQDQISLLSDDPGERFIVDDPHPDVASNGAHGSQPLHADEGRSVVDVADHGFRLQFELPAIAEPASWLSTLRQNVAALLHRTQVSDVAAGAHIAMTGGGGRVATVAAIAGLCMGGGGVATVCVVAGLVSNPLAPGMQDAPPRTKARASASRALEHPRSEPTATSGVMQVQSVEPAPSAAAPSTRRASAAQTLSRRRIKSRRQAKPTTAASDEFGFELARDTTAEASHASAPATTPAVSSGGTREPSRAPQRNPASQEFNPAEQEFGP